MLICTVKPGRVLYAQARVPDLSLPNGWQMADDFVLGVSDRL